jgi:hypothetical protein
MSDAIGEKPLMVEFCCDRCLYCIKGNDLQPIPRCPRCKTRMTPDDLDIPRDRYSSQRPQMARRKVDAA